MKIIPYESYVRHCKKSSLEVKDLINSVCASAPLNTRVLKFDLEPKPLVGSATEKTFFIYRNISYRNSFSPFAFGKICSEDTGSFIKVSIRMHALIIAFLILFETSLFSLLVALIFKSAPMGFIFMVFSISFIGYMLIYFSFWIEAKKLKEILETMFE
ncbi:MAG: hypothetical protein KGO49_11745 [Gammaproteobacteria bacterium]|nr:hypothetical protein [Gammaproteobacteria bacterium]